MGYVIKRIMLAAVTVFLVMIITFLSMHAVPGGPFNPDKAPNPAVQKIMEARYNLDKPVMEQFKLYLINFFNGDFGISLKTGREIKTVVGSSLGVSAKLGAMSVACAIVVGLILGVAAAVYRNQWPDRLIIFLTTLLVSVPSFVMATFLLYFFAMELKWVPVWSSDKPSFVLPVISLMLYPMSYITRLAKSSMLDVLGEDYIRTAHAKGLSNREIYFKHALRNAVLPVISYLGPLIAGTMTGSMVVETVFTMGGLGREFVESTLNRDYPLIIACVIIIASLMVVCTLAADLIARAVDPRIEFD